MIVGDSRLQLTLNKGENSPSETSFRVSGKTASGLVGSLWLAQIDGELVQPHNAILTTQSESAEPVSHASYKGHSDLIDWCLDYELTGSGRITKTLSLMPHKDITLERVMLWDMESESEPVVARTSLQDIAAFYRWDSFGIFVSLDFPYSKITWELSRTQVAYPPFEKLKAGQTYTCHSLTIGATQITGHQRYGFDDGEVDAVDTYVQQSVKPRFERPMFVSTCINNRYTQPQNNIIFYTMKDHPTLSFNTDLLKREISLLPMLGMEYYQLWTGPFDSVPDDPAPATVKKITRFAKENGVRVGDYSATTSIFCPHYNEYSNSLANSPEWGLSDQDVCFGNPRFVNFYIDRVISNDKNYGFDIHCLDFLDVQLCNNSNHGHPVGPDSIYAQVKGLACLMAAIGEVSPDMMVWSNSGNWTEFLPKIAWTNHNLYLTDPFIASPWQGLNMTRLLDDVRREQMVSLHWSKFIPYRYLTNCQYFLTQNSIVPDIRNYQYGALSTIAVTPNLCLAEIRPWLDRLPQAEQINVLDFYKHWTEFLKKHYDLWTKTYQAGEDPGTGSVEIYSHAKDNRGFVFIVNPNYWSRTVEVSLDSTLGFFGGGQCEVAELHPVKRLRLTAQEPFVTLGSKLPIRVDAQQVIVLEIRPAPATIDKPIIYGVPGDILPTEDGYLVKTEGQQGTTECFTILLPPGSPDIVSAKARPDAPKQPKRTWSPTTIKLLKKRENGVTMEVTFRRDMVPSELRSWKVKKGTLAQGQEANWATNMPAGETLQFPLFCDTADPTMKPPMWDAAADRLGLGPLSNFCGAYIENAFSEMQETWIDLKSGSTRDALTSSVSSKETLPELRDLPAPAKDKTTEWWLQTSFQLPFMYEYGCEPAPDEHTYLVLPFVRRSLINDLKVWINGVPLDVRSYTYPRNRAFGCSYADLVGTGTHAGENNLVVYFKTDQ